MSENTFKITQKCPTCGKQFPVLYPHQWAYRRWKTKGHAWYFCSWGCLRAWDDKKGRNREMKLTEDQKKKAVEIAMTGENPTKYLESCGVNNPHCSWWYIKRNLEKNDPEKYAQLPDKFKQSAKDQKAEYHGEIAPADSKPIMKLTGPLQIETPEPEKVTVAKIPPKVPEVMEKLCVKNPLRYDGFTVRSVEGEYGKYSYQEINGKRWFDYENKEYSDTLSMTIDQWRGFMNEIRQAALVLGVEL